ncbi:MAG: hypothetical protein IT431_00105 [Phycisphaerales bacterium]|nr:hypothetical protein [Phycisphaerales bacterium]
MRLPLSKVHRAFPELDRFSDEQCVRFVRAAGRRGWRPWVHTGLLLLLGAVLTAAVLAASLVVWSWFEQRLRLGGAAFYAVTSASCGVVWLLGAGVLMLLRDRLLIARVRYVVRARGACPGCGYSLLGIVVREGNVVVCPECGMGIEADPSLRELVLDEEGRTRFQPTERVARRVFWTARRVRGVKRMAKWGAVLLFVVLPSLVGGYELFLRWQAARAAEARPGVERVVEFIEAGQPAGVPKTALNAWDVAASVQRQRAVINDEVTGQARFNEDALGFRVYPYFDLIFSPLEPTDEEDEFAAEQRAGGELARALLEAYRERGLLDELDRLADAPRAVRVLQVEPGRALAGEHSPLFGESRELGRINAARMHLAWERGDREEFERALGSGLALGRMTAHQASLLQTLLGFAFESLAMRRVMVVLTQQPGGEWLDAIERAITRQKVSLPRNHWVEGERLNSLDMVAWMFSDPDLVRLGRHSGAVSLIFSAEGAAENGRLGTFAGNRARIGQLFDDASGAAMVDPHERAPSAQRASRLLMHGLIEDALESAQRTADRVEAERRAVSVMIALERHRLAHGGYPDSLAELAPGHLAKLPTDPWTGRSLVYLRGEAGYTLYALGPNGTDEGGEPMRGTGGDCVFSPLD